MVTRCPKCGSTERTTCFSRRELEHNGVDAEDRPFTHIVWRHCKCSACGQARVDKHYENRAGVIA